MRSLLNCFWTLLLSLPLCGQDFTYVNYNTREGLSGPMVYCMAQDHDGFMWFGTETGLSRFDGTRFVNFTTAEGLPDNDVIKLYTDSKNRVWIIPFKNSLSYYWRGKIYNTENDSLLKRLPLLSEIISIKENARGEILIASHSQIILVKTDGTIREFRDFQNDPIRSSFAIGLNSANNFCISSSTRVGFYILEIRGDSLVSDPYWNKPGSSKYSIYLSPSLEIRNDADSFAFLNLDKNRRTTLPMPEGYVSTSVIDDTLIALCGNAVYLYNIKQDSIEQEFLKGKSVSSVFRDREQNLWFTTLGEGIYRMASGGFKNYSCKSAENTLPVLSLRKNGDTLLAGTSQFMLWSFNTRSGAVSNRKIASELSIGRIMTFDQLPDRSLLAGTDFGIYKIAGKKISRSFIPFSVKSDFIGSDILITGTSIGIFRLRASDLETIDTVWTGRVTSILKKDNLLYFGTLNGLYILHSPQKATFTGNIHPALAGKITTLKEDSNGVIWVATNGHGLVGLQSGKVLTWLRKSEGMTSDICRAMCIVGDTLWIGTDKGLNRIVHENGKYVVTRYTREDGLISNTINAILVEGNSVFTGTPAGISHFEQDKVNTHSMCILNITAIRSPKQQWQFDTSGLDLGHWENDIRFEFAGISFKSAGEVTYRYRLKGLNNEWQETKDNFLSYLSLPSGDYELEIFAINKFGLKSEVNNIQFTIAKLLWEKTWFRIVAVLLLGLIVWRYVQYRIKKLRRQDEAKAEASRKITELEQMALKAQMNPHFIFNCLHSIQQFVIDKDTRGANKFITDFARLIRLTLDMSSQPKISLLEEVNYISTYLELEKSKYEGKFDYAVDVAENIDENSLYIPAMILQPFAENSIRHGIFYRKDNEGKINISFQSNSDHLICIVEDNGVGRQASEQFKGQITNGHKSKGMSLTSKRIDLLNANGKLPILANIEDVQENGEISGTRVTIRFPLEEAKKPE